MEHISQQECRLTNNSKNESAHANARKVVNERGEEGQKSPGAAEEANVDRRAAEPVEQHVRGHLGEEVADVKNRQAKLVLSWAEVQILFETLEASGGVIVSKMGLSNHALELNWERHQAEDARRAHRSIQFKR